MGGGADPDPAVTARARAFEALKLNFDMAKQVLATSAVVLSLILVAAKGSGGAIEIGPTVQWACGCLFASIIFGTLLMGRHVRVAERDEFTVAEPTLDWLGRLQQLSFVAGMGLVFVRLLQG